MKLLKNILGLGLALFTAQQVSASCEGGVNGPYGCYCPAGTVVAAGTSFAPTACKKQVTSAPTPAAIPATSIKASTGASVAGNKPVATQPVTLAPFKPCTTPGCSF